MPEGRLRERRYAGPPDPPNRRKAGALGGPSIGWPSPTYSAECVCRLSCRGTPLGEAECGAGTPARSVPTHRDAGCRCRIWTMLWKIDEPRCGAGTPACRVDAFRLVPLPTPPAVRD